MIHPSKLKNKIFGDTSKMFGTPAAVNTNQSAAKMLQQKQGQVLTANLGLGTSNQIDLRAFDTNRNVALKRLQVYQKF